MKTCRDAVCKSLSQGNLVLRNLGIVGLLVGLAWLVCGCAGTSAHASELGTNASGQSSSADPDAITTLRGWFNIVWNGEAHFFLTDDLGRTWELNIDEAELIPLGGPLALDRKRVEIEGMVLSDSLGELRVASMTVLPDE